MGSAFRVDQRFERGRRIVELELRGAGPLDVLSRCRCRVVTPEARIDAFAPARWLTETHRARTVVRVLTGRVLAAGRRRSGRGRWVAAGRALTLRSGRR